MKRIPGRWRLISVALMLCSSPVLAYTCSYIDQTLKLPASMSYLSGGQELSLISSVWHESVAPKALDCMASGEPETVQTFTQAVAVDSGKRLALDGRVYTVFRSDDPRIGVIAEIGDGGVMLPLTVESQVTGERQLINAGKFSYGLRTRVRLVALEKLPAGVIAFPGLARLSWQGMKVKGQGSYTGASIGSISGTTLEVKAAETCKLGYPSKVALKKIMMGDLPTVGSSVAAGSFQLTVNCGANTPGYTMGLSVYDPTALGGGVGSNNVNLVINGAVASGYGLQLLNAGKPMELGPPSNNIIGSTAAGGDVLNKTIDVRYVRTLPNTVPGKGQAMISVTLIHN